MGQDELEVTRTVDSTVVVMAPGMGDDVQAIKAGILECADVFAVNKADREGADATMRDLELMIALGHTTRRADKPQKPAARGHLGHVGSHGACGKEHHGSCGAREEQSATAPARADDRGYWDAPIVRCVALNGTGIAELLVELEAHKRWLEATESGKTRKLTRLREAMRQQLRQTLLEHAEAQMSGPIEAAVQAVARREIDPYTAAEQLVESMNKLAANPGIRG